MAWTPRARMVAAYEGRRADRVPVAPEFWYYIPARVLGIPMVQLELEVPHWEALRQTFRTYDCEGWGIVAPGIPKTWQGGRRTEVRRLDEGRYEERAEAVIAGRTLVWCRLLDAREPSWIIERPIKDFARDWPAYERWAFVPPAELAWDTVQHALAAVGEAYLLEVYVGLPFVDFAGEPREGGLAQVILDLHDHEAEMAALQARYIDYLVAKVEAAFTHTTARAIFVASSWSTLSLLSPRIWRRWEKPVLEAVVRTAHACGGLVHHHFHGRSMGVLPELAALGLDCICPFERPPGGDVTDLARVRAALAGHTTFNGNVHTVRTLIDGTPATVRAEVLEILEAFRGSPRLIVGTGDQVGAETPDENIYAMIETVKAFST